MACCHVSAEDDVHTVYVDQANESHGALEGLAPKGAVNAGTVVIMCSDVHAEVPDLDEQCGQSSLQSGNGGGSNLVEYCTKVSTIMGCDAAPPPPPHEQQPQPQHMPTLGADAPSKLRTSLPAASFYFTRLLGLALGAAALCAVPLFALQQDPHLGYFENYGFFAGYNPYVGLMYVLGSWARMNTMFVNLDGSAFADNPFQGSVFPWKTLPLLFIVAIVGTYLVFMAFTAPWGARLSRSYNMVYAAPVYTCMADFASVLFIKRQAMNDGTTLPKIFGLAFDVNGLAGVPMFLTFGAAAAAAYWCNPIADVLCPGVNASIIAGFMALKKAKVQSDFKLANLGVRFEETGLAVCLNTILNFSKLVMLPYAARSRDALLAVGLVASDIADAALYMARLAYERKQAAADLNHEDATAGVSTIGKEIAKRLQGLPASLRVRVRQPLCERADQYMAFATCPVMYIVAASLIFYRGNRQYYYLYECIDDSILFHTFTLLAVRSSCQIVILACEFAVLHRWGLLKEAWLMLEVALKWRWLGTLFGMAFVGLVFTSCFYVKHDGIAFFEFYCRGRI